MPIGINILSAPVRIELSIDEQNQLKERLKQSNLSAGDQQIFLGMIDFNHWLQFSLQEKKINIKRLQHAFFNKSEKSNASNPVSDANATTPPVVKENSHKKTKSPAKHPGRLGHTDYTNIEKVTVLHSEFKAGQPCPEKDGGRLLPIPPGNIIKITGQGFGKAIQYVEEKLR